MNSCYLEGDRVHMFFNLAFMGTELKIVWGEMNECCRYQARLQQNLMYLAAIADAQQPQAGTTAAHNPPPQVL